MKSYQQSSHCKNGHPWLKAQLFISSKGYKVCTRCRNEQYQRDKLKIYNLRKTKVHITRNGVLTLCGVPAKAKLVSGVADLCKHCDRMNNASAKFDKLICEWSLTYGIALTDQALNALVDKLGELK